MRLLTEVDLQVFQKLFVGVETKEIWLILSDEVFPEMLEPVFLPLDNKVTVANMSADGARAWLWESYQVSRTAAPRRLLVGRWTSYKEGLTLDQIKEDASKDSRIPKAVDVGIRAMKFGILEAPLDDPSLRRQDLTGLHLTCATIQHPPFSIWEEGKNGGLKGILGKVFYTLSEVTNFTYDCHESLDKQWGAVVNGKWTGMIKEVLDGTADVAVAALSMTDQRYSVVDFLTGMISSSFKIVMKRPSNSDYMWTVYTKQFEAGVWLIVIVVIVALSVVLYLVLRYSSQDDDVSVSESFFVIVVYIFGQSPEVNITGLGGRLVVTTVLFLNVLLLGHYTSNLTSALTVGPPLPPHRNLEDVYNDKSLTFGFVKGSATVSNFQDSKSDVIQKVWKSIDVDNDLVIDYEEGMQRVYRDSYALLMWEVYYELNHGNDCGVFLLPAPYFPIHTSFAMRKASPLVPILNKIVLEILSSGLLRKWWLELNVKTNDCNQLETAPIEIQTVLTPFLLLGVSLLLAFVFLAAERWRSTRVRSVLVK
ncbi:probable glutamate receptor [Penaeus monodon]|uniref:probable glutamate receptor n=1 Tax=Penaeus monodon TaxID=6687 RepID=UPI0018A7CE05|nr:probable glutamate receptor [Penaeus monodon]